MKDSTNEKVVQALKKLRDERCTKLYKEINEIFNCKFDFDMMVGDIQEIITRTKLKLTAHELTAFTDMFYKLDEASSQRLDLADRFFAEIDHANNQIVHGNDSVRFFYQ